MFYPISLFRPRGTFVTLPDFFRLIRKHLALVVLMPVALTALAGAWSYLRLADTYTATATAHVNVEEDNQGISINSSLTAAQMATNDAADLIRSGQLDTKAAALAGMLSISDYSYEVTSSTNSRVIVLSVTGTDAAGAARVADALIDAAATTVPTVISGCTIQAVGSAAVPQEPSGPNRPMYVALGLAAGAALALVAIFVLDLMDARVRSVEDAERLLDIPVLGCVPTERRG